MHDRLRTIMAEILEVSPAEITPDTDRTQIASWDSLTHINLVLRLQQEFSLTLAPDDILRMLSVQGILETIDGHGPETER